MTSQSPMKHPITVRNNRWFAELVGTTGVRQVLAWRFFAAALMLLMGLNANDACGGDSNELNWVRPGSTNTRATKQHGLSLAKPVGRASISDETQNETAVTVLRWRNPRQSQTQLTPIANTATTSLPTPNTIQRDSMVQTVSREVVAPVQSDPFNDPFAEQAADSAPVEEIPVSDQPTYSEPAELPITSGFATVAQEASVAQDDSADLTLPEPGFSNRSTCERIYNQRDCCAEDERCEDALARWDRDSISKISLDITPNFRPDEDDPYAEEMERDRQMSKAPVRTWHDRQGQELATGRLTNIKRGKLLVLTANNQVVKLPFADLCDDDLCFLTAWWGVPTECTLGDEEFLGRSWDPMTMTWKASGNCHKPLYFEEVQLERYGHTAGPLRQPVLSGAHFFLNLVSLPYQAGINPPWECRYALGYYRPGNCAPWLVPPVPLSVRGGLWQAGAIVGGVALFP
jgi:hypothetical protein